MEFVAVIRSFYILWSSLCICFNEYDTLIQNKNNIVHCVKRKSKIEKDGGARYIVYVQMAMLATIIIIHWAIFGLPSFVIFLRPFSLSQLSCKNMPEHYK